MNETAPDYHDPINISAAFFMILIGIIGLISNFLIVYIFIRAPTERTPFNVICVFRAMANIVILSWLFYGTFLPITLMGESPFSPFYETIVIGIANTIYSGLQNSGVYIAINRFCAMFTPYFYKRVFGFKVTVLVTSCIFIYRFIKITIEFLHFIPLECWMTYTSADLTWYPDMTERCDDDSSSTVNMTFIFVIVMGILNIATFTKIYFFYQSTGIDIKERNRKIKKNKALFLQTMTQDAVTLIDMVFTFKLSLLSNDRIWSFFCGTVIWQCVHSFDGMIMVMFNERLTFLKKTFFASSASPSLIHLGKVAPSVTPSVYPSRVE